MSNAMRTGKRTLAGVAAGALGAATLTLVAAAPAQAGVATTIEFASPSITVVGTAADFTYLDTPLSVLDAAGDSADDTTARNIQLTLTKPGTASDDSVAVVVNGDDTGVSYSAAANVADLAALEVVPNAATPSWPDVLGSTTAGAGTYKLTAKLINANNGATLSTAVLDINLVSVAAVPATVVTFHNSNLNVVDQYGVATDDSLASRAISLSTADGGALMIRDDSVSLSSSTLTLGTVNVTHTSGYPGVYTAAFASGSASGSAGTKTLTGTVIGAAGAVYGTSNLPVVVAEDKLSSAPTASVSSTPAFESSTDDTWQVPIGTSSVSFDVATATAIASGSVAWNVVSSAAGGGASKSGGAATIASSSGSVTLAPNAAASAEDEYLTITVGNTGAQDTIWVEFVAAEPTIDSSASIAKVSSAAPITGTITDQWGNALPGTWTVKLSAIATSAGCVVTSTNLLDSTAAAADGSFTVTAPTSVAPAIAGSETFYLCASNGVSSAYGASQAVNYTASGGVTTFTAAMQLNGGSSVSSGSYAVTAVPGTGVVDLATLTTNEQASNDLDNADVNASGTAAGANIAVSVTPASAVTYSGSDGVYFSKSTSGSIPVANGLPTTTTTASSANVRVFATKPGVHTVTVAAGADTIELKFYTGVQQYSGRVITANPTSVQVGKGNFVTLTATVTDIFGNPVPGDDSVFPTLFGGGTLSVTAGDPAAATDENGQTAVSYVAPAGTGQAEVTWTMGTGSYVSSSTYSGSPALVRTATAAITVTDGPTEKSITITGERTTVKGKPGIVVEGTTTGFDEGSKMVPNIKFPGETSYSAGSARPETSPVGDFTWERKTGKKIYVYFTNEDGSVKSNRVIIPAN